MKKFLNYFWAVILLIGINSQFSFAQTKPTDTDGDGYYNISTLDHLRWISENSSSWSWNFELDNDIDASDTKNWNVGDHDNDPATPDSAMGWSPIGNYSVKYTGKFDGHEHTISDLYINRADHSHVGFLGYTGYKNNDTAEVKNIGILRNNFRGHSSSASYSGGLIGENRFASINNCYATGSVSSSSSSSSRYYSFSGGLIGYNSEGSISNCYATGDVSSSTSSASSAYSGGLIGFNSEGSISNCYATGTSSASSVAAYRSSSGGLIGYNERGSISNCYATGTSSASSASSASSSGGLVGGNNDGRISNCYAIGLVKATGNGNKYAGGFLGKDENSNGTFSNNFWDTQTSGIDSSAAGTGKTTAQMKTKSTFTNAGWDFDSTWVIQVSKNGGYPYLKWQTFENAPCIGEEPLDTDGDGYRNISTLAHLRWISENDSSWTWNFELDNDIDASDTKNWNVGDHDNDASTPDSAMGWSPIGNDGKAYRGKFDGHGYKIDSLYIDRPGYNTIGFLGYVVDSISNIHLTNVQIRGDTLTGGLCGYKYSSNLSNSFVSGKVIGTHRVGGLCGQSLYKTMSNSYANITVIGESLVGGLCGYEYGGTISKSYVSGKVIGIYKVGGLCGDKGSGTISGSYSSVAVSGDNIIGGFCGVVWRGANIINSYSKGHVSGTGNNIGGFLGKEGEPNCTFSNNFWDTQTSGQATSAGEGSGKIEGKTTAEMKTKSTFTNAGWDFNNIWFMNATINSGYPDLRWNFDGLFPAVLNTPIDMATKVNCSPVLVWYKVKSATSYNVVIATDSLFANIVVNENIADTTYSPVSNLQYGTNYFWKVNATDGSITSDWSDTWSFTTKTLFSLPSHWAYTDSTGSTANTIVLNNGHVNKCESAIQNGDVIGAFYLDNGIEKCAGYSTWESKNLSITIWGDNSQTPEKDGMASNENVIYKLWDAHSGIEYYVDVHFSMGEMAFSNNGINIIDTLNTKCDVTHSIQLASGWNMVSTFVEAENDTVAKIINPILDNFLLMKNMGGNIYFPDLNINNINTWNIFDAYYFYMNTKDTLEITGKAIDYNTPIILNSGWNGLSYICEGAQDVAVALDTISDNMLIVKNSIGQIYFPNLNIKQLSTMKPGEGYLIYMNSKDTLIYSKPSGVLKPVVNENIYTNRFASPIPFNQTLIVKSSLPESTEIIAYSNDGLLVGSGIVQNGKAVFSVYGDNSQTDKIDGLKTNEKIILKAIYPNQSREHFIDISSVIEMLSSEKSSILRYKRNAISEVEVCNKVLGTSTSMMVNPNPTSNSTELSIQLENTNDITVELFDLNGKLVSKLYEGKLTDKIQIDCSGLASGVYQIVLYSDDKIETIQLIIQK